MIASRVLNGRPIRFFLPCRRHSETLTNGRLQVETFELSLAYIGTASATEFGVNLRVDPRRFRLGGKKEAAGMFAADAVSLWRLNQSAPGINYLARSTTVEKAHSPSPYSPSMAQASVRGACGFVLVAKPEVIHRDKKSPYHTSDSRPIRSTH